MDTVYVVIAESDYEPEAGFVGGVFADEAAARAFAKQISTYNPVFVVRYPVGESIDGERVAIYLENEEAPDQPA